MKFMKLIHSKSPSKRKETTKHLLWKSLDVIHNAQMSLHRGLLLKCFTGKNK